MWFKFSRFAFEHYVHFLVQERESLPDTKLPILLTYPHHSRPRDRLQDILEVLYCSFLSKTSPQHLSHPVFPPKWNTWTISSEATYETCPSSGTDRVWANFEHVSASDTFYISHTILVLYVRVEYCVELDPKMSWSQLRSCISTSSQLIWKTLLWRVTCPHNIWFVRKVEVPWVMRLSYLCSSVMFESENSNPIPWILSNHIPWILRTTLYHSLVSLHTWVLRIIVCIR